MEGNAACTYACALGPMSLAVTVHNTRCMFMALQTLDIGMNRFSGDLSELNSMTWLQLVRVDNNNFSGPLPANVLVRAMVRPVLPTVWFCKLEYF